MKQTMEQIQAEFLNLNDRENELINELMNILLDSIPTLSFDDSDQKDDER